ncbi:hypothetical protein OFO12_02360 [Campylobacter sp. JMF_04 NA10]|nr:hypothetical protein [Campylobacter sp. JMF_04 NA10]
MVISSAKYIKINSGKNGIISLFMVIGWSSSIKSIIIYFIADIPKITIAKGKANSISPNLYNKNPTAIGIARVERKNGIFSPLILFNANFLKTSISLIVKFSHFKFNLKTLDGVAGLLRCARNDKLGKI